MFFEGEEFILDDSAYVVSEISIPTYKPYKSNSRGNTLFNRYLVGVRIKVEHGIGCLKRKFQSLKGLNIQILNTLDYIQMVLWIKVCTILHNLLFQSFYDPHWDDVESIDDLLVDPHTYQTDQARWSIEWKRKNIKFGTLKAHGHIYNTRNRFIR